MLKRITLVALATLIALPVSSFALGFLSMKNPTLTQLDASTYRVRVDFDWGGPTITSSDIHPPINVGWVTDASVTLGAFAINTPGAFNFFGGLNPGPLGKHDTFASSDEDMKPVISQVGFDFKYNSSMGDLVHVDWDGRLDWEYRYFTSGPKGMYDVHDIARTEHYAGGFDFQFESPIPEPTTIALFGSGLIGLALVTRRRRITH